MYGIYIMRHSLQNGLEQAKKDVAEYSEEAMAILAQMTGVTEPEKSFLYDFVEYLIHRNK